MLCHVAYMAKGVGCDKGALKDLRIARSQTDVLLSGLKRMHLLLTKAALFLLTTWKSIKPARLSIYLTD